MEVVFFATLPSETTILKVQGLLFFGVFFVFSAFHSGPHFSSFFGDFRVAKAPVLELVGLIFRHQKKELKKGLRVYAGIRDYWGGGVPLNKITVPPETAFQHQFTPAVPEGTVADT